MGNNFDNSLNHLSQQSLVRLIELTRKLAAPYELQQLLQEVLESSKLMLQADSGSLWLYDATDESLEMQIPAYDPLVKVRASEGLVGQCMTEEEIINVPDCYADPRFNQAVDKATGYRTHSLLSIPLMGLDQSKVGVMQLINKLGGPFNEADELLASALAAQCAMALQRAQMTNDLIAKERRDEEVMLATQMQQATLPDAMPSVEGYEFYGFFQPAEYTGGDLYDLIAVQDRIFILLGDATGHGFGPALSATQMHAMLRVSLRLGADLDAAYTQVNNHLSESLPDDRFITAFVGFLDPQTHTVNYHSGGQGPILLFRAATQSCEWYKPTLFPMGVMDIDGPPDSANLVLQPGDILGLISDGIYEYCDQDGEEFGEARVGEIFEQNNHLPLPDLATKLLATVGKFADTIEQADDVTLVLVRRDP